MLCSTINRLFVLVLTTLCVALGPMETLAATIREQQFNEALAVYESALNKTDRDARLEQFHRAELLFGQLIYGDTDPSIPDVVNAKLYVNMGNAALQAERLGPAILAFRYALKIDPAHRQARQNLSHTRSLLPPWASRSEGPNVLDTFLAWRRRFSKPERAILAVVCFFLSAVFISAFIRWQRPLFRNLALFPLAAWLVLMLTDIIGRTNNTSSAAVVIVPNTTARAADSPHAPMRFQHPLPSGVEVDILEDRDQWVHVRLSDGRDAWVVSSSLGRIQ